MYMTEIKVAGDITVHATTLNEHILVHAKTHDHRCLCVIWDEWGAGTPAIDEFSDAESNLVWDEVSCIQGGKQE
jgi:hypothetical protein